jgi:hypothetical protein
MLITVAREDPKTIIYREEVGAVFALVGTEGIDLRLYLVVIDGLSYLFPVESVNLRTANVRRAYPSPLGTDRSTSSGERIAVPNQSLNAWKPTSVEKDKLPLRIGILRGMKPLPAKSDHRSPEHCISLGDWRSPVQIRAPRLEGPIQARLRSAPWLSERRARTRVVRVGPVVLFALTLTREPLRRPGVTAAATAAAASSRWSVRRAALANPDSPSLRAQGSINFHALIPLRPVFHGSASHGTNLKSWLPDEPGVVLLPSWQTNRPNG